jgi:hypothetical protein
MPNTDTSFSSSSPEPPIGTVRSLVHACHVCGNLAVYEILYADGTNRSFCAEHLSRSAIDTIRATFGSESQAAGNVKVP